MNETKVLGHYLYPSTLMVSSKPMIIQTILGSCVSVCFYDKINGVGGLNHFMLPFWNGSGLPSPKFGNIAIEKLLQSMIKEGAREENIKAKIFGGAAVLNLQSNAPLIGERNIHLAEKMLLGLNIPIVNKSIGGKLGRKILFHTKTGEVKLKFINRIAKTD